MIVDLLANLLAENSPLRINSGKCVNLCSPKATCKRCLQACPAGGIVITTDISVNDCSQCGACISACPNGVFEFKYYSHANLISTIFQLTEDVTDVLIYCSKLKSEMPRGLIPFSMEVRCLAGISKYLLLACKATKRNLYIYQSEAHCAECPSSTATEALSREIVMAEARYFNSAKLEIINHLPQCFVKPDVESESVSDAVNIERRRFFSETYAMVKQMPVKALHHQLAGKDSVFKETFVTQKQAYVQGLKQLEENGARIQGQFPATALEISGCYFCGICSRLCPSGALKQIGEANDAKLLYNPANCNNCGLCADLCIHQVISFGENLNNHIIMENKFINVGEAVEYSCQSCGKRFLNDKAGRDYCLSCNIIKNQ